MNRDLSLDTMRGLAILAMVVSGIIAFGGNQPVWMYHAQMVTSAYVSNSTPPITWNDLVFPFFVFSMGAAIPLSLSKRLSAGKSKLSIVLDVAISMRSILSDKLRVRHYFGTSHRWPNQYREPYRILRIVHHCQLQ